MNGVRSTFMRRGYLLTALAALLLLAASTGTAEAQRVTVGFDGTSGTISENAYIDNDALLQPQMVKIKVEGLSAVARARDITSQLGDVTITPSANVYLGTVSALTGRFTALSAESPGGTPVPLTTNLASDGTTPFANTDEITLVVAQSGTGAGDNNWFHESIELKLEVGGSASVSPDIFTLMIEDRDVAPVAAFTARSFSLTEGGNRNVSVGIFEGARGEGIPGIAGETPTPEDPGPFASGSGYGQTTDVITLRVSNHTMVTPGNCQRLPSHDDYGKYAIGLGAEGAAWSTSGFPNTGLITTVGTVSGMATGNYASLNIQACPDMAGIANPEVTLTILDRNLVERPPGPNGNIVIGPPLMVTAESDEAAPTLTFSPTDVTIDEGGSVETVLLADGPNAGEVGMVKLMVEGDAMVDLYQGDEMLEEMNGYVMVDLGGDSSARLMAMSMESRELQDGDMAYKAWKLVEGETDGAHIGEGSWFKVDVVGSTAVPALPLIGQLLLALFLMAGGSRLYRRRRG